jgi:hypothetical protein
VQRRGESWRGNDGHHQLLKEVVGGVAGQWWVVVRRCGEAAGGWAALEEKEEAKGALPRLRMVSRWGRRGERHRRRRRRRSSGRRQRWTVIGSQRKHRTFTWARDGLRLGRCIKNAPPIFWSSRVPRSIVYGVVWCLLLLSWRALLEF